MKKLICFLTAWLCLSASLMAAGLINPGFEQGDPGQFGSVEIPGWITWGTSGWHHDDAGNALDTKAMKLWWDAAGVYQDFAADEGILYQMGVQAKTATDEALKGWDFICKVEWYDEYDLLIESVEVGRFIGEKDDKAIAGDPVDMWLSLSSDIAAPAYTAYGRFVMYLEQADNWESTTGGSINFDNAFAYNKYAARNPNPADTLTNIDPATVQLQWQLPQPRVSGNTVLCDLWFGTDPNMPGTNTKVIDKQNAADYTPTVVSGQTYYWQVNCYDTDSGDVEILTDGDIWSFDTTNLAPIVDAGIKQSLWLDGGSASVALNAQITDDGLPNPPGDYSITWTVLEGTGTPVFAPGNTVADPVVTFTQPGDYVLQCAADDSESVGQDTILIRVFNQGETGLIAHWKLDETTGTVAFDTVGGHDGAIVGDTVLGAPGQVNTAFTFDGDGDYVDCGGGKTDPNDTTWADLTDEITLTAWVKGTFDQPWQSIVNKGDSAWRLFRYADSDNVRFALNGVGSADTGATGIVNDNQWHHLAGTYDGVTVCIYLDGILAQETTVIEGASIAKNLYDLRIASDAQVDNRPFKGSIDEVKLYTIGHTAEMIQQAFIDEGGSHSCGGNYPNGDINQDCYVDLEDFSQIASTWLDCTDVANPNCN